MFQWLHLICTKFLEENQFVDKRCESPNPNMYLIVNIWHLAGIRHYFDILASGVVDVNKDSWAKNYNYILRNNHKFQMDASTRPVS
jgi:hypothetical protein